MTVCGGVVGSPIIGLLVPNDLKSTLNKQGFIHNKTNMSPIFANDDKYPVLLWVLLEGVLSGSGPCVFSKGTHRFARSVAADDQNLRRSALMDRFLVGGRLVEFQSLVFPLLQLARQLTNLVLLVSR